MKVRLVTGFLIAASIGLVVLFSCMIGIFVSGWKSSTLDIWNFAADQTQVNIEEAMNASINFVKFAAYSVPYIEPLVAKKIMPFSGYDPYSLIRAFEAYDKKSGFNFGSFGLLMRSNVSSQSNAKLSWQVAKGFGCQDYIYAFSDQALNPIFHGYCSYQNGTTDLNVLAYDGFDWGLKPEEAKMLDGEIPETFLPVFNLLGQFTLTFESGYPENTIGPKYAVTFAELNLQTFSQHIATEVSVLNGRGIAYIFETQSGGMIASTIPNSVVNSGGVRYFLSNTSDLIQMTHNVSNSSPNWVASRSRRVEPGLDWTIVVAIQYSDVYGDLNYAIMVACLTSMAVLVALIIILCLGGKMCISKPLQRLKLQLSGRIKGEKLEDVDTGPFHEFDELQKLTVDEQV